MYLNIKIWITLLTEMYAVEQFLMKEKSLRMLGTINIEMLSLDDTVLREEGRQCNRQSRYFGKVHLHSNTLNGIQIVRKVNECCSRPRMFHTIAIGLIQEAKTIFLCIET